MPGTRHVRAGHRINGSRDLIEHAANVQLALLFTCGYLTSRLMLKAGLPERLVSAVFARHLSEARLIAYLLASTAGLSFFIPNAVTVITVLPVLALVQRELCAAYPERRVALSTMLALSVIYGANIGGLGSLTGTPANGILAVYATIESVPSHGWLRFDAWLAFGVPLMLAMVVAAWAVICLAAGRGVFRRAVPAVRSTPARHRLERLAIRVAVGFIASAVILSAAMARPGIEAAVLALSACLAVALGLVLFVRRADGGRVLELRDCYEGLPLRGLAFVAGFVAVAVVLAFLGVIDRVAGTVGSLLPPDPTGPETFLGVALATSFATEVFSNTVVELAMFEALTAAPGAGPVLFELMLTATLSCTCAFMSPLATGVNGLVFGEVRGASLRRMLATGALMNLLGAALIAAWVHYAVVPWDR